MKVGLFDGHYFGINPLGSTSITTASGGICYDADFYAFGGELAFTNRIV